MRPIAVPTTAELDAACGRGGRSGWRRRLLCGHRARRRRAAQARDPAPDRVLQGPRRARGARAARGRGPVDRRLAGNAGLGIAWAAGDARRATRPVVVAETASQAKLTAWRRSPVTLDPARRGIRRRRGARARARRAGRETYVSSYNDTGVIAGQATIGRELDAQLPAAPTVACPLRGEGEPLVRARPVTAWSPGRARRRDRGRALAGLLDRAGGGGSSRRSRWGKRWPTASPGTSSRGRSGSTRTGPRRRRRARSRTPRSRTAIRFLARAHGIVAEGAGAAAVAGVMCGRVGARRRVRWVVLVTGRNIALERLAAVLATGT